MNPLVEKFKEYGLVSETLEKELTKKIKCQKKIKRRFFSKARTGSLKFIYA